MFEILKANRDNLEDLNEIFSLYQEFYEIDDSKIDKESNIEFFKELLSKSDLGQQFIAYIDGKAVGMITLYFTYSSLSKCKVGILNDLYLKEEFRGKGYGKKMINFSMDFFGSLGIKKMTLETHPDNFNAQKLYESLGGEGEERKIYEFSL